MLAIVVPVFNEVNVIDENIERLHDELSACLEAFRIVIVDNQSSDDTFSHAEVLAEELASVSAMRIPQAGKARAIRAGWEVSDAEVLGFVDVDLSPSITTVPDMVATVEDTHGLAVSSRHLPSSDTYRSWDRSLVSTAYNLGLRVVTGSRVSDHQCGLKVLHRDFWEEVSSDIRSTEWFLDTELILHAKRLGRRIDEFAVRWEEGPESAVNTVTVSWKILVSLYRFWRQHGFNRSGGVLRRHPRR